MTKEAIAVSRSSKKSCLQYLQRNEGFNSAHSYSTLQHHRSTPAISLPSIKGPYIEARHVPRKPDRHLQDVSALQHSHRSTWPSAGVSSYDNSPSAVLFRCRLWPTHNSLLIEMECRRSRGNAIRYLDHVPEVAIRARLRPKQTAE